MELLTPENKGTIADKLVVEAIQVALKNMKHLNPWEQGFIKSIQDVRKRSSLTGPQWNTLSDIFHKLRDLQ